MDLYIYKGMAVNVNRHWLSGHFSRQHTQSQWMKTEATKNLHGVCVCVCETERERDRVWVCVSIVSQQANMNNAILQN